MSAGKLVLITGATGHLGFKALLDLLSAGYKARIAVRSEAKEKVIVKNPTFKSFNFSPDSYEFIIVPDIVAKGAYDNAIKGVDYVIHIASPLASNQPSTVDYHKVFIEPAVTATLSILEAAKSEPKVKRVVITSSVIAVLSFKDFTRPHAADEWFNAENRVPNDDGPYNGGNFQAYSASKIASLNATEEWMKSNGPTFDVVNIHPSFIMGRDDLDLTAEATFRGTNNIMLGVAFGKDFPTPMPCTTVHNDDVARLHVESLKSSIPAGSYIANGPAGRWEDIPAIVEKLFPKAVEAGILSQTGKLVSLPSHFDAKKTEETFGWKLQSFESQVQSVVGRYLELAESGKKA